MTSLTSWRRAALKSRASVSGSGRAVDAVRASSNSRRRSPSHVPPGSRVRCTSWPAVCEVRGKSLRLGRLAGPIRAFERDEPAAADRCPGTSHGPSVADGDAPTGNVLRRGRRRRVIRSLPGVRTHATMGRRRGQLPLHRTVLRAALAASVAAVLVPAIALAHPLGNFTINHYAGVRVEPDRILLDVVIDQAEIPTFQARRDLDTDGDGQVSRRGDRRRARSPRCDASPASLDLHGRRRGRGARPSSRPASRSRRAPAACRRCASCASFARRPRLADRGGDERSRSTTPRSRADRLARDRRRRLGATVAATDGTSARRAERLGPADGLSDGPDRRRRSTQARSRSSRHRAAPTLAPVDVRRRDARRGGGATHRRAGPCAGRGAGRDASPAARGRCPAASDRRGPAVDLPHAPTSRRSCCCVSLADGGRPRRGARAHAGPRQDAHGGLPRRDARDGRSTPSVSGCR